MVGGEKAAFQKAKPVLRALGKEHELKLHIRGSLNNGLTKDEIKEVFLQVAIYCGVPAAV
ncbi:MAG TPA: carboxymuconolactone decarboxylase family protein, partial [Burkholderiales bacterium]|nr:carboxymuconolactone decarboxylase family protein [Burkholderiales bacterium]